MTLLLMASGVVAGLFSGLFGIGGGIILVPSLVYFLGFNPKAASGTSLTAMLLPVGALGVYQYYRSGVIGPDQLRFGLWIALGMFVGAFGGAKLAIALPIHWLQKGFSVLLVFAAVRLWMQSRV
jgi:hypothetical protein